MQVRKNSHYPQIKKKKKLPIMALCLFFHAFFPSVYEILFIKADYLQVCGATLTQPSAVPLPSVL